MWDADGRITQYASTREIIDELVRTRPDVYTRRRVHELAQMQREVELHAARIRFVRAVCDGEVRVMRVSKQQLHDQLHEYPNVATGTHEYLHGMPIHKLSQDRITQLEREVQQKQA